MTWTPLKHVAEVSPSNVDKLTVEGELPVRLINYTDVYYGNRLVPHEGLMSATATKAEIRKFQLRPGDVIMTKDSETPEDIGVAACVERSEPGLVCGYHLSLVRPRSALGRYLYYAISSAHARDQMSVAATGITRFGLRSESIASLSLWLPLLEEQRAIADYLDTETARIDALITKKRRLIQLLEERGRLLGEERLQTLRRTAPMVRVKYLVDESDERHGQGPLPLMLSVSIHLGVVPRSAVSDKESRAEDCSNYKTCRPGDIAINRMRAFQGGVGIARQEGVVSPDYTVLHVRDELVPTYLHFVMRSSWFVGEMIRRLRGIGATDQGQVRTPRINFADLGLIEIPVPPLDIQFELAERLTVEAAKVAGVVLPLEHQLGLLAEHRQALITAAVTGELRVGAAA